MSKDKKVNMWAVVGINSHGNSYFFGGFGRMEESIYSLKREAKEAMELSGYDTSRVKVIPVEVRYKA